jgi:outer membrane protein OmpA-like peptidoglycan-associated protein
MQSTPFEALIGGHYALEAWRAHLGFGPGLSEGLGSPSARFVAGLAWFPDVEEPLQPEPLADRDGDGVPDPLDVCPDVAGSAEGEGGRLGCPAPLDSDGDGIGDDDDACPAELGEANVDATRNGCPAPRDGDGDGVLDGDDACPEQPGPTSDRASESGCPLPPEPEPPPDADGDGTLDADDACPNRFGPAQPLSGRPGCPDVEVVDSQLRLLRGIEFESSEATISEVSIPILEAVLQMLEQHPEVRKVIVEGHCDSQGSIDFNTGLSQSRATAVMDWLVARGIDPSRLRARGLGPARPIDTNDTPEGRQNHRRVEFHIVETEETGAGGQASGVVPPPRAAEVDSSDGNKSEPAATDAEVAQ